MWSRSSAGQLVLGRLPGLEEAVIAQTALTDAIGIYSFPYDVLAAKHPRTEIERLDWLTTARTT